MKTGNKFSRKKVVTTKDQLNRNKPFILRMVKINFGSSICNKLNQERFFSIIKQKMGYFFHYKPFSENFFPL